jgi:hypothetical protein
VKASDFSRTGSDWARQILQPPQSSWPTNTSVGRPAWAVATRVMDDAEAIARPTIIADRLFSISVHSSWKTPQGQYERRFALAEGRLTTL